jgi:hypothetical protein
MHRNIIELYDTYCGDFTDENGFEVQAQHAYTIMEFFPGKTLL